MPPRRARSFSPATPPSSINLVAYTWARANLKAGDLVILTEMEHHSNLVPWHHLAAERGVVLEFIPVTADGLLDLEVYRVPAERIPKLVAFTGMSNVLGTINPVAEMIRLAHALGRWCPGGWGAVRPTSAGGCAGPGCGFPGFLGP